jgi:hypothetical protein
MSRLRCNASSASGETRSIRADFGDAPFGNVSLPDDEHVDRRNFRQQRCSLSPAATPKAPGA